MKDNVQSILLSDKIDQRSTQIDVSQWMNGVFYVTFTKSNGQKLTKTLLKI